MKKGFTLIELLAVIVILAIIALIATPIVLNIITDTKGSATLRSADFYLDAVEYAIANKVLNNETLNDGIYLVMSNGNICLGTLENGVCSDELEVEVNGEAPISGTIAIKNGEILYVERLEIGSAKVSTGVRELTLNDNRVICKSVTKETRLQDKHYAFESIDANHNTVLSNKLTYIGNIPEGNYEPGDEYLCEVKPGTVYRFYVLSTNDDNTINLIMDQNITSDGTPATEANPGHVAWVSEEDYLAAGGTPCTALDNSYNQCSQYDKGPITAMNYLKNAVSDWTNIDERALPSEIKAIYARGTIDTINSEFVYADDSYQLNMESRARMIYLEEGFNVGCKYEFHSIDESGNKTKYYEKTCPLWLTNNMQFKEIGVPTGATQVYGVRGYWTMNPNGGEDQQQQIATEIYDHIDINSKYVYVNDYKGVRPVITLPKENLK